MALPLPCWDTLYIFHTRLSLGQSLNGRNVIDRGKRGGQMNLANDDEFINTHLIKIYNNTGHDMMNTHQLFIAFVI